MNHGAGTALALAEQLIARRSLTPHDDGCQALIQARLAAVGFECHTIESGPANARVRNLWALRSARADPSSAAADPPRQATEIRAPSAAREGPLVVFAGHTDVVPTGPLQHWKSDPFVPTHRGGLLFGRGAADMKTSLACMVVAAERFVAAHPAHGGAIGFLVTSDEEGPALDGTVQVVRWLAERGVRMDACIVGEPTSVERLGDMVKNGRRGSLSARMVVKGVQGHIAYPHLADNPIHRLAPALAELATMRWDEGNAHFPATSWQVSNLHAGTGAGNVIPGEAVLDFNFRFGTASSPESLQERLQEVLRRHRIDHSLEWTLGGSPFLTTPGTLTQALAAAILQVTGLTTELSTTGGTSDGRFIATVCPQVVECGPVNASIHQIDEHVAVSDIEPLAAIYQHTLERMLA